MSTPVVEDSAKESSSGKGVIAALRRIFSKGPESQQTKDDLVQITQRRRFVTASILGVLGVNFLMFLRFFFPRALFEPKTKFRIGYPSDFGFGIDQRFLASHRIWVVRDTEGLFVISAVCTHLGCTPEWKAGENKFKCPCHGSGYDSEGVNFEGPAPRPMDRAHVEVDPEGQIVVDLSHLYRWPKGERSEFNDPGAILRG
jgi:cytochrome b6-f complex iron-sulfur subunit